MNSTQRVINTIQGKPVDRQPIYGWLFQNLTNEITQEFGSVADFEDRYEFDLAHLFGGPRTFKKDVLEGLRLSGNELTPDILLEADIFNSPDCTEDYAHLAKALEFHKKRCRFCYVQTPGFFEQFNDVFGIENQLLYLSMYPDELAELYKRQADWTICFAGHCIDLGIDMIHLSDDWGAQNNMMFSPKLWRELIYPNMKRVVDYVHSRGAFASLHSDGCIMKVADGIADIGLDVVHPWQESAGMSYDTYIDKYSDKFAIMGGICIQTALGILSRDELEKEIRRVFSKLKGRRWICCTTHFVQNHCKIEDLVFAYDLIKDLANNI